MIMQNVIIDIHQNAFLNVQILKHFCVQGYCRRRAYIATQLPVPFSLVDIWRLVYDTSCGCIIALDQPDNEDMVISF